MAVGCLKAGRRILRSVPPPSNRYRVYPAHDKDATVAAERIDLFLEETSQLLQQMKQAVADVDIMVIRRTAHTLKPSSGTVGAHTLAACCADLEQPTHSGVLGMAAIYFAQIESAYIQAARVLAKMRASTADARSLSRRPNMIIRF